MRATQSRCPHGLLGEILQRLEIIHDVGHRGTNAFAATNRGKIRELFSVCNGQREESVADPGLLDLDIVRYVFDEFVNSRLVLSYLQPGVAYATG
jgi:hypothetical protein